MSKPKRDGTSKKDIDHWSFSLKPRKDGKDEPGYGMEQQWKDYCENWSLLED